MAEIDPFVHMGQRFRPGGAVWDAGHLVAFVILLALVVIGVWFLARYLKSRDEPYHNSRALFAELCRAHRLDRSSRRLLAQLARRHQATPASVFVQPGWFAIDPLSGDSAHQANRLKELGERLFGAK